VIGVFVFGLIAVIFILLLYREYNNALRERKKLSKKLEEDELLFDKLSGQKFTVEEAEKGVTLVAMDLNRIKSDDEINETYSGFELEKELVINNLKKEGYKITEQPVNFEELIGGSAILTGTLNWSWAEEDIFELSPFNFLILSCVTAYDKNNYWIVLLIIETERNWGHYLATPITEVERWALKKQDEAVKVIPGYKVDILSAGEGEPAFTEMLEAIPGLANTSFEVMDKLLIVASEFKPSTERMDEILNLYNTLQSYKPLRVKKHLQL
jgi:hypothetical protein